MPVPNKASLSPTRRRLLELFQRVNFGRLESLVVANREPVLDPRPVVIREHKFAGENGPRPELATDDFLLKQQVVELFGLFDELRDGVIDVLEIKHGLPFLMIVTEVPA
jgi:hypothetical protein